MHGGEHLVEVGERRVEENYRLVMIKAQDDPDTILIRLRVLIRLIRLRKNPLDTILIWNFTDSLLLFIIQ